MIPMHSIICVISMASQVKMASGDILEVKMASWSAKCVPFSRGCSLHAQKRLAIQVILGGGCGHDLLHSNSIFHINLGLTYTTPYEA